MPSFHYSFGIIRVEANNPNEHFDTIYVLCPNCGHEWLIYPNHVFARKIFKCVRCSVHFNFLDVVRTLVT